MKKHKYAVSKITWGEIIKGHKYPIYEETETSFFIKDEDVAKANPEVKSGWVDMFCLKKSCGHINGYNWKLTE